MLQDDSVDLTGAEGIVPKSPEFHVREVAKFL